MPGPHSVNDDRLPKVLADAARSQNRRPFLSQRRLPNDHPAKGPCPLPRTVHASDDGVCSLSMDSSPSTPDRVEVAKNGLRDVVLALPKLE